MGAELFTCSGTDNQKWMLQGKAIVNIASGKCLDINNHNMKKPSEIPDETKVELYSCNGLWNQQWELENGKLILHLASAWTSMVAVFHRSSPLMGRRRNCTHVAVARPTRVGRWAAHWLLLWCEGG